MYQHLYNIKKFIPFNNNSVISNHFNLKNHNFYDHFSFFVLKIDVYDLNARLKLESFMINFFSKINLFILNDYIPIL